jgi:hypothetical protein
MPVSLIKENYFLSTDFFEIKHTKIKFHLKSFQWGISCSMRTDGLTDMKKLVVALRNFATWIHQVMGGIL